MRIHLLALAALACSACGRNANIYDLLTPPSPPTPVPDFPDVTDRAAPDSLALVPYLATSIAKAVQVSRPRSVDLLISVDNSGSMDGRIARFETAMPSLVSKLLAGGVDFQAGIVKNTENSTAANYDYSLQGPTTLVKAADTDPTTEIINDVQTVLNAYKGGDERPIESLQGAYSVAGNAALFRASAYPVYLILSDAIDLKYSGDSRDIEGYSEFFSSFFASKAKEGRWLLNAIGSPSAQPCSDAEFTSQPLIESLVVSSGGLMGRVCETDYSAQLALVGQHILSFLTETPAPTVTLPEGATFTGEVRVTVDGALIPSDPATGYVWDSARRVISFPGSYVPASGKTISIEETYVQE